MKSELASLTTSEGDSLLLRSVTAKGRVEGLLLSMTLHQVFRNDTQRNLEVTYTFPLASGAVLLGMTATLGAKRLTGQVIARTEARERYEDAIESGDAPIMLEHAQRGVFSASLGSLTPGEEAVIELTYAQMLAFNQGRIRLVVPTTIAPRYGDPLRQGGLQPDQVVAPDLLVEHGFGLTLTITGVLAQARVNSPTHSIAQQREPERDALGVSLQGQAWLDRDFVLLFEGLAGRSFAIAGPDERSGKGHVAMIASYCPNLAPRRPADLRLKLLVDCSGSMAGASIAQSREGLRRLACGLTPEDQVSFSRFGNHTHRVLPPASANERNVRALLDAIEATDAVLGGTEMADALQDTIAIAMGGTSDTNLADVLLITDGEVWDTRSIAERARSSGHRIYALGVGSAPAESLLLEMAEATGGACEFVTPGGDMAAAIERLIARVRSAQPIKARIEMDGAPLWSSPLPRRIATGETMHVFTRLPASPARVPILIVNDQEGTSAPLSVRDDDVVARLVAARQIDTTADDRLARELAERYQLVTQDSNLFLVVEREASEKTDGMPDLHQVRPMVAAGWGGTGRIRAYINSADLHLLASSACAESVAPMATGMAVSSVWRTNRARAVGESRPPSTLQIPALIEQYDIATPQEADPSGTRSDDSELTGAQIIAAFNAAAGIGQFRQALRAVTRLPIGARAKLAILRVALSVGSRLDAWACYLLWLNQSAPAGAQLTPAALALVQQQLRKVDGESVNRARALFDARSLIP